jgi:hypothetical protein
MLRNTRFSAIFALLAAVSLSASGQSSSSWRTANDIREGGRGSATGTVTDIDDTRNRLYLELVDDRYSQITVEADSISTQYNGFGGVINGKPEIFTGSAGFSNLREGDRVEVRGTGRGTGIVIADTVTLLGRNVAAATTGVGSTRPPSSVSTPAGPPSGIGSTTRASAMTEGMVRQINLSENRLVVETDRRELLTVRTTGTTPVYYRNEAYQLRNLEVGDRIRVDTYAASGDERELRARSIEVTQSVQDRGTASGTTSGTRAQTLAGRVTRVDTASERIWIDTGRGTDTVVDLYRANDSSGRHIRVADVRTGDSVELTGTTSGGTFVATTIRQTDDVFGATTGSTMDVDDEIEYVVVSLSANVVESLETSPVLVIRDRTSGRSYNVHVTEDFTVRTKAGGYTTADKLKVGDALVVKAYRDDRGNHVAQTIRYR